MHICRNIVSARLVVNLARDTLETESTRLRFVKKGEHATPLHITIEIIIVAGILHHARAARRSAARISLIRIRALRN